MTHPARNRLVAAAAAVLSVGLVAALVARGAIGDRAADRAARAALAQAAASRDAGDIDAAAAHLRTAAAEAAPLLDGRWAAHAWSRTLRPGELADLRRRLDDAVAELARSVDARKERIDGLRRLRAEVDYAATLAELDAIEARRTGFGPLLAADAPSAHDELVRVLARRRADFAADAEANADAIRRAAALLESAGNDPRALLAVFDSVLPRPARAGEAAQLAELKARASSARSALLAGDRLREAEGRAALAPSAREARSALAAVESDPDLARPADASLAERIASARAAIARRIDALAAWEASVAAVERGLAAGEPGAAARALAELAPCDDRTRAVAERLRASFGPRAIESFTAGAIAAADRGDLDALERRADAVRPGGAAWSALGAQEREKAAASVAAIDARVDRALYDEFLRSPCAELAARYLEGWPARVRRMAPWVLEWRARADGAPVRIALEGARWRSLGVEPSARTLEDRPDAEISVRGPGGTEAAERAEDIREDSTTTLGGASFMARSQGTGAIRVDATVAIDLRDAVAADPVARGSEERPFAAWRCARVVEVPVRDPLWGERPHLLLLRVTSPGLTALPPFPRR